MSEMRKYSGGRWYTCRTFGPREVFYIFWTEDRRSKRQSTGTTRPDEAQAFLDEWLIAAEAEPEDFLCADLYRLKYPEGENERADCAWKHLERRFSGKAVAAVRDADEARYIAERKRAGAAQSTIRAELSMLRASWNWAVQKRMMPSTALPALDKLPAASPPRDRWLRDPEAAKLLAAAEAYGRRAYLFLWLALETAARRTAIQDLLWGQVDWETGVIHYLPEGAVQTRKRRASVPISKALRPVLEAAYAERGRDPFVIGEGGKVNEMIRRVAERAEVAGVTPHVLRHTAATRMARRGVPLWIIAKVLGNTVEQVEKVYAKHSPEMLQSAVDAISGEGK